MSLHHVVSPKGWLVVRDEVYFMDALPLPRYRAMDLGGHNKALSISVVAVRREDDVEGFTVELPAVGRRYVLRLERARSARGTLGAMAHVLVCGGDVCDLSVLLALASPLDYPRYAARVFRALAWVRDVVRAKPWIGLVEMRHMAEEEATRLMTGVFDALSNPKCIKALWVLAYDKSPPAKEAAAKCGLWRVEEGVGGQFTTLGALAYMVVAHLLPPQCRYLPKGFECRV
mgnify:CR=1 FL=1